MNRSLTLSTIPALLLLLSIPIPVQGAPQIETIAPGVTVSFSIRSSTSAKIQPDAAIKAAMEQANRLYREMDEKPVGELEEINKNAGKKPVKVSSSLLILLKVCRQISDWTQGAFDVVRNPPKTEKKEPTLLIDDGAGQANLTSKKDHIDLRTVRSGYMVDRMAGYLKSQGFTDFMIVTTGAGDVTRTLGRDGNNYWRINIPDPNGSGKELCRVSLESSSVATASVRDLQGIVARSGKILTAPTDLRSVTVITQNATIATALASTALLMGRERAQTMFASLLKEGFGVILEDRIGKIKTMGDVTAACFEE